MDDSAANLAPNPDASTATPSTASLANTPINPSSVGGDVSAANQVANQTGPASPSIGQQVGGAISDAGNLFTSGTVANLGKGLAPVIGGAGIINAVAGGTGKIPQKGNIENIAAQQTAAAQPLLAAGAQITQAADNGQLPQAEQAALQQQLQQQISQIQAQYASMGLGGSTMEQQAIQTAQNNYQSQVAAQLQSYMTQGLNDINSGTSDEATASNDLSQLAQVQMSQSKDMSNSIAEFLAAMTGGGLKAGS